MKYVSGVFQNKKAFYGIFFLSKKSENRCSSLAAESRKKSRCNQPATLWTILLAQVTTLPLCVIFCCQRKRPYLIIMIINFFVVDNNKKIGRAEWNKNYTRRALGFFFFFNLRDTEEPSIGGVRFLRRPKMCRNFFVDFFVSNYCDEIHFSYVHFWLN